MTTFPGLCVSDFNIENLVAILRSQGSEDGLRIEVAPFGQVVSLLLDEESPYWKKSWDFLVVWTRPEAILPSFQKLLNGEATSELEIEAEVDSFVDVIEHAGARANYVFIPTWSHMVTNKGRGLLDLGKDGVDRALLQANLRLIERLEGQKQIKPMNSARWLQAAGAKAFNPRLWYLGKIPFSNEVFREVAADVISAVRGLHGRSRKLIILDLDEVIWGGIVGEDGWEHLRLGGHDPAGEALLDFQRELKALVHRGVILGIVSKNTEANALAALDHHPEMILRRSDFAAWRINWNDKAANVAELLETLNLPSSSAVFIDDSKVERSRVQSAFPDLLVPDWPQDKRFYRTALLALDCFNTAAISDEDRRRTDMYAAEHDRTRQRVNAKSAAEWLATLETSVTAKTLDNIDFGRAVQLLNKTNQMNLSTRRLSEAELVGWLKATGQRNFWTFRVADKFGDSGLVGLLSTEVDHGESRIVDFILSCRVIGRKVEETMLHVAVEWAREVGAREIVAAYLPTLRNNPCLEFFRRSGFRQDPNDTFVWSADRQYPSPGAVALKRHEHAATCESAAS